MRLLPLLSTLIIEDLSQRSFKLNPAIKGNKRIEIYADNHQQNDRKGFVNPAFAQYNDETALIRSGNWRQGAPNSWIVDSIRKRFDKVYDAFETYFDGKEYDSRIFFVDNILFEKDYYTIEYVLIGKKLGDGKWRTDIITSAIPEFGGKFLYRKKGVPELTLSESKEFQNIPIIYLWE